MQFHHFLSIQQIMHPSLSLRLDQIFQWMSIVKVFASLQMMLLKPSQHGKVQTLLNREYSYSVQVTLILTI